MRCSIASELVQLLIVDRLLRLQHNQSVCCVLKFLLMCCGCPSCGCLGVAQSFRGCVLLRLVGCGPSDQLGRAPPTPAGRRSTGCRSPYFGVSMATVAPAGNSPAQLTAGGAAGRTPAATSADAWIPASRSKPSPGRSALKLVNPTSITVQTSENKFELV